MAKIFCFFAPVDSSVGFFLLYYIFVIKHDTHVRLKITNVNDQDSKKEIFQLIKKFEGLGLVQDYWHPSVLHSYLFHLSPLCILQSLKYNPCLANNSPWVPISTTFPRLITKITSASCIVERRCAIVIQVRPSFALSSAS